MTPTLWRTDEDPRGPLEAAELVQHMREVEALLMKGSVNLLPSTPTAFVNLHDEETARQFNAYGFSVGALPPNSGGPPGKPYRWEARVHERYHEIALRVAQEQRREARAAA